jgi:plastocyanin
MVSFSRSRSFTRAAAALAIGSVLAVSVLGFGAHATPASADPAMWLTEVSTDNAFSQPSLSVPAGADIWLTLQNDGQALHNWRVLGAKQPDGSDIGTKLLSAGQNHTIGFVISEPGTYTFLCDVHPVDMRGTLIVQ